MDLEEINENLKALESISQAKIWEDYVELDEYGYI